MSLSNPQAKNPATRFMQWRGGNEGGGRVTWYDKEAEEEKEVALPFSFIVLDELSTITGFSESDHSGFWSNEVRNLQRESLVVRTSAGIRARGRYSDISDEIKSKGAKYAKSVYIAFKDEQGELQIGNIKIAGAAMTAWIDFQKKFDVSKCAVFITETPKRAKKGSNYYYVPVFEGQNMSEATKQEAVKLDEELQQYLNNYFQRKPDLEPQGAEEVDDGPEDDGKTDTPTPAEQPKADDVEIEDLDKTEDAAGDEEEKSPEKPKAASKKSSASNPKIPLKDVPF